MVLERRKPKILFENEKRNFKRKQKPEDVDTRNMKLKRRRLFRNEKAERLKFDKSRYKKKLLSESKNYINVNEIVTSVSGIIVGF